MKKILAMLILVLNLSTIPAQEIFNKYVPIRKYDGLPLIQIESVDDFIDLASSSRSKTAFLSKSALPNSTVVLIMIDSTFYSFNLIGYNNIADYRKGMKIGYPDGVAFYDSMALGINSLDIYNYYKKNAFLSTDDCKKAFDSGYVFPDKRTTKIVLPLQLPDSGIKALAGVIPTYAYEKKESVYELIDPKKRAIDQYLDEAKRGFFKPAQFFDSHIYYLVQYNEVKSYNTYAILAEAVYSGYQSIADLNDSKSKGYTVASDYYDAVSQGFPSYEDLKTARRYNVKNYKEYEPIKEFMTKTDLIMKKEGLSFSDSAFTYLLSILPSNKIYQMSMIVSSNDAIIKKGSFDNYLREQKFENTESRIIDFLKKNPEISGGKFNREAVVFVK